MYTAYIMGWESWHPARHHVYIPIMQIPLLLMSTIFPVFGLRGCVAIYYYIMYGMLSWHVCSIPTYPYTPYYLYMRSWDEG